MQRGGSAGEWGEGQVVTSVAAAYGCAAKIQWSETPYIPTVNSREMVERLQDVALRLVGKPRFLLLDEPSMAGEDFSFLAGHFVPIFELRDDQLCI
jgi:metal-dependent amidase/aminoacylase/carboxypeptidase family protein